MEDNIPIKLDPGLISSTSFKDPFQKNPEDLTLYNLITRINHEREGEFLGLREDDLLNEIVNEKVQLKLERQRERNGDDNAKKDIEKFMNIFQDLGKGVEVGKDGEVVVADGNTGQKVEGGVRKRDAEGDISIQGNQQQDTIGEDEEQEQGVNNDEGSSERQLLKRLELEKQKLQKFHDNREQLLKLIKASLNEASLSLDFVSLLVTSVRPNAGKTSMSPHLKQYIPLGSLNSDRIVSAEEISELNQNGPDNGNSSGGGSGSGSNAANSNGKLQSEEVNKKAMISWKLESLQNAMNLINKKSNSLKHEVKREKNYFENLNRLSVVKCLNFFHDETNINKESNYKKYEEVLFKVNESEIGIKYGFQDSGSRYKLNRGVAVLEKTKANGALVFNPVVAGGRAGAGRRNSLFENRVVVKIFEKVDYDELILTSESSYFDRNSGPASEESSDSESVEGVNYQKIQKEVNRARNRIFEEELFYQLIKEAKILLSYRVKIISNNKILIELDDELIEITYVTMNIEDESILQQQEQQRKNEQRKKQNQSGEQENAGNAEYNNKGSENTDSGNPDSLESNIEEMIQNNRKADYVINFLRLMLCHYHKTNLYEGNSANQPLSATAAVGAPGAANLAGNSAVPLLLRPLIGHINHEKFLKQLIKNLINLFEELRYKVTVTKKQDALIYKTFNSINENTFQIQNTKDSLHISLLKNNNFDSGAIDKNNVFGKIVTPTSSLLKLEFSSNKKTAQAGGADSRNDNVNSGYVINLTVKTASPKSFCDCLINLELLDTSVKERDGGKVLNVNYSDIAEIKKCLRWVDGKYIRP